MSLVTVAEASEIYSLALELAKESIILSDVDNALIAPVSSSFRTKYVNIIDEIKKTKKIILIIN